MFRLFLCVVCCMLPAIASDHTALLEKIRIQMIENLMKLPNYTCLQTIERTQRRAPSRRFELIDMVRLEVALVNGNELFSWPGAGKFEDKEIYKMVTNGAIGNGNFALHAKGVFQASPIYTYAGEETVDGRKLLRWDYRVPLLSSGYTILMGEKKATVGYHGSFWADPESLDVVKIAVEADDIPLDLQLLRAGDSVEYKHMEIGGQPFLLPTASELHMLSLDNTESVNRIRFSGCRQYLGESKLVFSDPDMASPASQQVQEIKLPPDAHLLLSLESTIHSNTSAVGDPVTFRLQKPVKQDGVILFDKGAEVKGRITMLRKHRTRTEGYVVGIQLIEIQSPLKHGLIDAKIEDGGAQGAIRGADIANVYGYSRAPAGDILPQAPGSVLFFRGTTLNIMRGAPMIWRTVRETN